MRGKLVVGIEEEEPWGLGIFGAEISLVGDVFFGGGNDIKVETVLELASEIEGVVLRLGVDDDGLEAGKGLLGEVLEQAR